VGTPGARGDGNPHGIGVCLLHDGGFRSLRSSFACVFPTHAEGCGIHVDLQGLDANDLAGLTCSSGTPLRRIVRLEPIQRPSQALVSRHIGGASRPQHVCDWLLLSRVGPHRHVTIVEPQSVQDHRRWCRSSAHLLASGRIMCVSPGGQTFLLTDSRDDPQMIQPFIDSALCSLHTGPSAPTFLFMNCGMWGRRVHP
jgi:hypothetical protein